MSLQRCLDDHGTCLAAASRLLGETARAVELSWECEQLLRPHLRLEVRSGIQDEAPIVGFDTGLPGHEQVAGLARYRLEWEHGCLRIVRVSAPGGECQDSSYYDFWAVGHSSYRAMYRVLRTLERRALDATPPLMPAGDADKLYANTVGFLRHGCQALRRYGVPQRRGVLLLGEPGNGKTMACRWIRAECQRRGLVCRSVSAEEFRGAMADGQAHTLFQLNRPGVIFFDDFDSALRDRDVDGTSTERTLFLSGLDGIQAHQGVVYVFTSNARLDEIDPAIRRPGRLDLILMFRPPAAGLRRQLICTRWHEDLLRQLAVEQVVQDSEGLSFAELEELKKLLVLQQIETGSCDWARACRDFRQGRGQRRAAAILGFAPPARPSAADPCLPQTAAHHAPNATAE